MDVLFPFGHGLSYTTFAYENLRLEWNGEALDDASRLRVTVTVRNTGTRSGEAAGQL